MTNIERRYCGYGHGKVILLGEHAVVYGSPALVGALDIGVEVEAQKTDNDGILLELNEPNPETVAAGSDNELGQALQIIVDNLPELVGGVTLAARTTVPLRAGLGSSAALAVAIVRSLSKLTGRAPTDAEVATLANRAESVFHGQPSGVDAAAAAFGSLLFFTKNTPPQVVAAPKPLQLVLALVEPAPPTHEMVARVRAHFGRSGDAGRGVLAEIEALVRQASRAVESGDLALLGRLIDENQVHLRELTVSTPRIDDACRAARAAGALGAKLTGAGGGGMVLALAPGFEDDVCRAFERIGAIFVRPVRVGGPIANTDADRSES